MHPCTIHPSIHDVRRLDPSHAVGYLRRIPREGRLPVLEPVVGGGDEGGRLPHQDQRWVDCMCIYALMLVGYTNTAYTALCYALLCHIILGDCRSVQVDDFSDRFAFKLIEGPSFLLAFKNQDRPGAISQVQASTQCCGATVTTTYQE